MTTPWLPSASEEDPYSFCAALAEREGITVSQFDLLCGLEMERASESLHANEYASLVLVGRRWPELLTEDVDKFRPEDRWVVEAIMRTSDRYLVWETNPEGTRLGAEVPLASVIREITFEEGFHHTEVRSMPLEEIPDEILRHLPEIMMDTTSDEDK